MLLPVRQGAKEKSLNQNAIIRVFDKYKYIDLLKVKFQSISIHGFS